MKLLFNIGGTNIGNKEFKDLLGYIDADIKFDNLRPDVITATKDVISIIGKPIYDYAFTHYNAAMVVDLENEDYLFVRAIQYAVAVNAYMLYAPSNDLSHTNDGRKMRNDEHEKNPFEWMIDRDNKNAEKRYYRALDDLIFFLNNTEITALKDLWITSDEYKAVKSLFINTVADFNRFYNIESSLLLMKIAPGIRECERREIVSRIGVIKYNFIKTAILTDKISGLTVNDQTLLDLCQELCANYALAWALPRFSVTLFPEGVLQYQNSDRMSTQAKKPALFNEPELARQTFANNAKRIAIEIENFVKPAPAIDETIEINPKIVTGATHFST